MSSNDNFEKKYFKYKNKYIELKNQANSFDQTGGFAPISDLTEHLRKTDERLTKLEQGNINSFSDNTKVIGDLSSTLQLNTTSVQELNDKFTKLQQTTNFLVKHLAIERKKLKFFKKK